MAQAAKRTSGRATPRKVKAVPSNGQRSDVLTLVVEGERYPLDFNDLTAIDVLELRKATGWNVPKMAQLALTDNDVDVVAAWVWLSRRAAGERHLSFIEVAETLHVGVESRAEADNELPEEAADDFPSH